MNEYDRIASTPYDRVVLERFRYFVRQVVSRELLSDFADPPEVLLEWIGASLAIQLRQEILGQQRGNIEIRYPADWWQAVKQRFFPSWAKNRWPVQEIVQVVDVKALYPKVTLPGHSPVMYVARRTWRDDGREVASDSD